MGDLNHGFEKSMNSSMQDNDESGSEKRTASVSASAASLLIMQLAETNSVTSPLNTKPGSMQSSVDNRRS